MLPRRIIARLDIKGPNVIKGIQMEGLRVVGEPSELARKYSVQGADELVFIDTVASLYGRQNLREIVASAANELFIPLTVGGGIRSLDDARMLLMSGADKVALNSGAIRNPRLITEIARIYGEQCVVLSVEAKESSRGVWEPYIDNGREPTGLNVVDWCYRAVSRGAGEILLTSVDRDGTKKGLDINLVNEVCESITVPVVASGGTGKADHVCTLFSKTKADAVAIGTALHYSVTDVERIKCSLAKVGVSVRPPSS